MKNGYVLRLLVICFGMSFLAVPGEAAYAQTSSSPVANAAGAALQVSSAFSGSRAIHSVDLTGDATWYAGSLQDSGTVTLTASDDGSSQMQLSLDTTGQMTESRTGKGASAQCQWSGKDGVAHNVDVGNCWRPALWFLPAFSLQPSAVSKDQVIADLGNGAVGFDETSYHHLRAQILPAGTPSSNSALNKLIQRSTTDIGLDSKSSLPMVLAYSVHPNNGALVPIAIEVHYSDYRAVDGVQIPFHIQRYVNGSLQLDIQLNSASVN